MKRTLLPLIVSLIITTAQGQTNVSGGIFSNTTWTLVNSPYIVVDTVAVFPGVTLTIQPGVTIKFADNKRLEIRSGSLIAAGTATDSITFTSNSSTPSPGIWGNIYLNGASGNGTVNLNYCNIKYADNGIKCEYYGVTINNSNFTFNNTGIYYASGILSLQVDSCDFKNSAAGIYGQQGTMYISNSNFSTGAEGFHGTPNLHLTNCTFTDYTSNGLYIYGGGFSIDNCTSSRNQTGIYCYNTSGDIINSTIDSNSVQGIYIELFNGGIIDNCRIRYNDIGLRSMWTIDPASVTHNIIDSNNIGIKINVANNSDNFSCNHICNNTLFDFYNNTGPNVNVSNNYWCTLDSISTQATIYDAHTNVSVGLVYFMPLDETQCYLMNGINNAISFNNGFQIYPNPSSGKFNVEMTGMLKQVQHDISVYDMIGEKIFEHKIVSEKTEIDFNGKPSGIYFVAVRDEKNNLVVRKIVKM